MSERTQDQRPDEQSATAEEPPGGQRHDDERPDADPPEEDPADHDRGYTGQPSSHDGERDVGERY